MAERARRGWWWRMLKPTALGRFGDSFLSHVSEDGSDAFQRICAQVGGSTETDDLRGDAGDVFGNARIEAVVSTLRTAVSEGDGKDVGSSLLVGLFISDPTEDDALATPRHGPMSGQAEEVDFAQLLDAVASVLPGRHLFVHRSQLVADAADAELAFALPINFWRSSPPFGPLIGARFELDARGVRDGWITLDCRDDEVVVGMTFARDIDLTTESIVRAWEFLRRNYDKAIVPRRRRTEVLG